MFISWSKNCCLLKRSSRRTLRLLLSIVFCMFFVIKVLIVIIQDWHCATVSLIIELSFCNTDDQYSSKSNLSNEHHTPHNMNTSFKNILYYIFLLLLLYKIYKFKNGLASTLYSNSIYFISFSKSKRSFLNNRMQREKNKIATKNIKTLLLAKGEEN